MERRKYKVVAGSHYHDKEYNKGDIFITDIDVMKKLPGKFQDMGPAPEDPPARVETPTAIAQAVPVQEVEHAEAEEQPAPVPHPAHAPEKRKAGRPKVNLD